MALSETIIKLIIEFIKLWLDNHVGQSKSDAISAASAKFGISPSEIKKYIK